MKLFAWFLAIILAGGLSVQLFRLYQSNSDLDSRLSAAQAEASELAGEQARLQADVEYLAIPENLAKELKTRFDFKRPGEKLIKIQ